MNNKHISHGSVDDCKCLATHFVSLHSHPRTASHNVPYPYNHKVPYPYNNNVSYSYNHNFPIFLQSQCPISLQSKCPIFQQSQFSHITTITMSSILGFGKRVGLHKSYKMILLHVFANKLYFKEAALPLQF